MKDKRVYLMQVGLKTLGFYTDLLDGDEGPKTKAAFAMWEASINSTGNIPSRIVERAASQIGVREVTKNQGPGIEKYWTATTYPDGFENREPYCAAFVCWAVREACVGQTYSFTLPKSPVAYDFESWGIANAKKGVTVKPNTTTIKPGDIFTLSAASHVGIIKSVGKTTVVTIEGNTDGSGSREGDGVYERIRTIVSLRKVISIVS
jgi:hypothetical protein